MTDAIILAAAALAVGAALLARRRRREQSIPEEWATAHGWLVERGGADRLMPRLERLALMQIGYSRRIVGAAADPNEVAVFEYVCETGLDHDRLTHRWIGVAVPLSRSVGRATISSEPWVIAAASRPATRRLPVRPQGTGTGRHSEWIAMVDDDQAWARLLEGEFGARLSREPSTRSWDVLPDLLVGYQPAPIAEGRIAELVSAGKELSKMLDRTDAPEGVTAT